MVGAFMVLLVFRVNLLTSPTQQMSYLRSLGPFLSKPPDFANLLRFFQDIVFAMTFRVAWTGFAMAYALVS